MDLLNLGARGDAVRILQRRNTRVIPGGRKPNPWGLHDLIGNVWEWCEDVWHTDCAKVPSTTCPCLTNVDRQPRRSLRGAAWNMDAFRCRSAYRSFGWKDLGVSRFGLRIAVSI